MNLYGFVGNDGVRETDNLGLATWAVNANTCSVTLNVKAQLKFVSYKGTDWTPTRISAFMNSFEKVIEDAFNNANFMLVPRQRYYMGFMSMIFGLNYCCPCYPDGFKPKLNLEMVTPGDTTISEDWEVEVKAYTGAPWTAPIPRSNVGFGFISGGWLSEADVVPVQKVAGAPGTTQVNAVHEFGHALGLNHPGNGIDGVDPYAHKGKDKDGNNVDGGNDLMGGGSTLRGFYFDKWRDKLNDTYPCNYSIQ